MHNNHSTLNPSAMKDIYELSPKGVLSIECKCVHTDGATDAQVEASLRKLKRELKVPSGFREIYRKASVRTVTEVHVRMIVVPCIEQGDSTRGE